MVMIIITDTVILLVDVAVPLIIIVAGSIAPAVRIAAAMTPSLPFPFSYFFCSSLCFVFIGHFYGSFHIIVVPVKSFSFVYREA